MLDATARQMYRMHVMNEPPSEPADTMKMPTLEQLAGRQVRLLRQSMGWSQLDVAEKMRPFGYEWSQATVTRLEAATRPIRLNELADLAVLFGIPLSQFLPFGAPPEFEWDDLEAFEREVAKLKERHSRLREQIADADATASGLARARAEAAAELARIEGQLEGLMRWHPGPRLTRGSAEGGGGR